MLRTRIITAFFLLAGLLGALFYLKGDWWEVLALVVILLAAKEWVSLTKLNRAWANGFMLALAGLGLLLIAADFRLIENPQARNGIEQFRFFCILLATVFWLVCAPLWLKFKWNMQKPCLMSVLGVVVLLEMFEALCSLRDITPWLLLVVITCVNVADSAAYFAGKQFGKHKLAPSISPGKTWEGVAGALFAVTLFALALCFWQDVDYLITVLYAWFLVGVSIVGDLFESLLKRQAGLKDSGNLLPGHGGVLDRIDGLIPTLTLTLAVFALPILFGLSGHLD